MQSEPHSHLVFSPHALEQMEARGVTVTDVAQAIDLGITWVQPNGRRAYQALVGTRWLLVVRDTDTAATIVTIHELRGPRRRP